MKPIGKFFKIAQKIHLSSTKRFFSDSTSSASIFKVKFTSDELKKLETETISQNLVLSIVQKLKESDPKLLDENVQQLEKEITDLYNISENFIGVQENFDTIRSINQANHEMMNILRNKIKTSKENLVKIQSVMNDEIERDKKVSQKSFALKMIETIHKLLDNHEHIKEKEENNSDESITNMLEGIRLIEQNALVVLRRFAIDKIKTEVGDKYDEKIHEVDPNSSSKKGKVKKITKIGFKNAEEVLHKVHIQLE